MMNAGHSLEEKAAASAVAALSTNGFKRTPESSIEIESSKPAKMQRLAPPTPLVPAQTPVFGPVVGNVPMHAPPAALEKALQPAPYFYYKDHSEVPDHDPLTPLTPPGRVPNFPAKMHAILCRPDLADVVAWMPHGRSWRVLKPREFEIRVIPTYFEHSKFSSFIRQANGWGFRRVTQGRDRNSYYHELFLRGLPHLCKEMRRPGVAEKAAADTEHEPDFYKISEEHPVPEKQTSDDDSIMLRCTLVGGPKARMPVYAGSFIPQVAQSAAPPALEFNTNTNASSGVSHMRMQLTTTTTQQQAQSLSGKPSSLPLEKPASQVTQVEGNTGDKLAFPIAAPVIPQAAVAAQQALQAQAAANAQFAAGFLAGSALSSTHIRNVLGQALVASNPLAPAAGQLSTHRVAAAPLTGASVNSNTSKLQGKR
mmetsp:Transcript_26440/g.37281  ORF Transcript_26440/g.37281 Transcript_26440/m.37281 type:complete len:424 (+) Transcript_26440:143-1414(+)